MEKTLYVEIFQPFAQYRNPFTFFFAQSFPLPAISQVVGMLQNITKKYYDSSFYNLKYSIHGYFETSFWNYQQFIKGDLSISGNCSIINKQKDNPLNNIWHPLYNNNSIIFKAQRTPTKQQELFNGRLFIFIKGDNEKLDLIKESIENLDKVVYLGRSEDIAFIRKCEYITPTESKQTKIIKFNYPCWFELKDGIEIKNQIRSPVYYVPIKQEFNLDGQPIHHKSQIIFGKTKRKTVFRPLYLANSVKYYYFSKDLKCKKYKINDREFLISEICWIVGNSGDNNDRILC